MSNTGGGSRKARSKGLQSMNDYAYDSEWQRVRRKRQSAMNAASDEVGGDVPYDVSSGNRSIRQADDMDSARKRRNLVPKTVLDKYY